MNKKSKKEELFEKFCDDVKGEKSISGERLMDLYEFGFSDADFEKAGMTPEKIEELNMDMGYPEKKSTISARL